MIKKSVLLITMTISISGCTGHRPIVDTQGMDMSRYEADLAECQQYAEQVSAGEDAAIGAGLGATLGWALSAVSGSDKSIGAGVGAVSGGATGLGSAANEQKNVISRCLQGRGYKVLN